MSGLCRLFSASISAAFFLMLWQFMRMHRKFFCLYVFLLLVVLYYPIVVFVQVMVVERISGLDFDIFEEGICEVDIVAVRARP